MTKDQAMAVAKALGGLIWRSGGDSWLVAIRLAGSKVVCLNEESVIEYKGRHPIEDNLTPLNSISLTPRAPPSEVDGRGHMYIFGLSVEPGMMTIADLIDDSIDE